jgi:hypothetical protein
MIYEEFEEQAKFPRGIAWLWALVYGSFITSIANVSAGKRIRVR